MYRTQQYREVNRAFGPYLPPHPMRGLGVYRGMGEGEDVPPEPTEDSTDYPWGKYSPMTQDLQARVNNYISYAVGMKDGREDVCYLSTDGSLGPQTCGAAQFFGLMNGATTAACKSYALKRGCNNQKEGGGEDVKPKPQPQPQPQPQPVVLKCSAGQIPGPDGKSCVPAPAPLPSKAAGGTNWTLILGGVALLGVGAFILLRKKH